MEETICNRGAQGRLPLVGPGDQNLIRKETLAAGSLRSRPPGSFFNEKMLSGAAGGCFRLPQPSISDFAFNLYVGRRLDPSHCQFGSEIRESSGTGVGGRKGPRIQQLFAVQRSSNNCDAADQRSPRQPGSAISL